MSYTGSKARTLGAVQLEFGDGATPTEVFIPISEVTSTGTPADTRGTTETSNFQSVGKRKEFTTDWIDSGELAFEGNWLGDASQDFATGVMFVFDQNRKANWKLIVPNSETGATDGIQYAFKGQMTQCHQGELRPGTVPKLMGRIRISGAVTKTTIAP